MLFAIHITTDLKWLTSGLIGRETYGYFDDLLDMKSAIKTAKNRASKLMDDGKVKYYNDYPDNGEAGCVLKLLGGDSDNKTCVITIWHSQLA